MGGEAGIPIQCTQRIKAECIKSKSKWFRSFAFLFDVFLFYFFLFEMNAWQDERALISVRTRTKSILYKFPYR